MLPGIALLVVLFPIFGACGGSQSGTADGTATAAIQASSITAAPQLTAVSGRGAGDTLRLLFWQAPTILNPHLSVGTKDLSASRIVYEPLATFNAAGEMLLVLAAEIPTLDNGGVAADGRSVTWKLKSNVRWADGEPFTADDVVFTYEYITNPDVAAATAGDYANIASVEAIDDTTVKITFTDVTPNWVEPFVGLRGMILPRHVFREYAGANAADAPANLMAVGTGAYKVTEFTNEDILIIGGDAVSTNKIRFDINPYYREPDKPFFRAVELQGGGDAALAAEAVLVDGSVDFAWNVQVPADQLAAMMAGSPQGRFVNPESSYVEYILINFTDPNVETADGERSSVEHPHPFLTDLAVRQAIAHSVDRDEIAALYGETGPATTQLLISPATLRSPNETPYDYDLERAAALLDAAGWVDENGDGVREQDGTELSVVFQTSTNTVRQATQEIVKRDLTQVGFRVELKSIDSSVFLGPVADNTNTRRHFYADLEMFAFGSRSPDPGAWFKGWTCAEAAQKANNWATANWGRYCNEEFDRLYEQSATEIDPSKRRELIIRMNDLLVEDVAMVPLVERPLSAAISTMLEGFAPTAWDADVWNLADWRRTSP
jgi:peptide/nickel transport system substrate-binding protein